MLTIKKLQLHGMVLSQRKLLIQDIQEHLAEYRISKNMSKAPNTISGRSVAMPGSMEIDSQP